MTSLRTVALTAIAMTAFAGNSLLCRLALKHTSIDAASFTTIRLVSGALMLWLIVIVRRTEKAGQTIGKGNWLSACALFAYAAGFSFAYISLSAATGALLLFGAVQATMIGYGIWQGERLRTLQLLGLFFALAGMVGLLLPGLSAPPLWGSVLMLGAGVAWGVYSLRGKGAGDPSGVTAGNFLRTVPMTLVLSLIFMYSSNMYSSNMYSSNMYSSNMYSSNMYSSNMDTAGVVYAIVSGAITSGIGYAIWYAVLPALKATHAATVQLSVPVLAAIGGVTFLGEALTLRLLLASAAILGGIALVILEKQKS